MATVLEEEAPLMLLSCVRFEGLGQASQRQAHVKLRLQDTVPLSPPIAPIDCFNSKVFPTVGREMICKASGGPAMLRP